MDAGSPGCKPVPRDAESCKGRGVVRVGENVGVCGFDDFGVCGDTTGRSDSSDSDEIGRFGASVFNLKRRFFMSEKDSIGRRLANDEARDKGIGGRFFSQSQDFVGTETSDTSGVIGPSKLCVDELDGVLTCSLW
jgi:hypothetical protein